jgi:hypothetical protein
MAGAEGEGTFFRRRESSCPRPLQPTSTGEWYDFFLYGTATGLVFGKLFFPNSDPYVSILTGFAVYAVGFLARPVGAAIFDLHGRPHPDACANRHLGRRTADGAAFHSRRGRRRRVGRLVLLAMEFARTDKRRGLITSCPQFGVPAGLFLANLAVLGFSAISGDGFLTWGRRIPFLLSAVLIGIGLWIRLGILETPTFRRLVAENKIEKLPVREVLKRQPKEILLSAFARMSEQAPFYIFNAILLASVLAFVWIPHLGQISDRIGRRRMYRLRG